VRVLHTSPERKKPGSLGGKGFEVFLPLYIRSNGWGQETVPATVSLLSLLAESLGALALDPRNPSSTRASKQQLIIQVLSQV
jgi:hypothetical protein